MTVFLNIHFSFKKDLPEAQHYKYGEHNLKSTCRNNSLRIWFVHALADGNSQYLRWWEVGEGACTMSILTGAGRGGLHHVNIDCDFAGSGLQLGAAQNRRSFDDTVCV